MPPVRDKRPVIFLMKQQRFHEASRFPQLHSCTVFPT